METKEQKIQRLREERDKKIASKKNNHFVLDKKCLVDIYRPSSGIMFTIMNEYSRVKNELATSNAATPWGSPPRTRVTSMSSKPGGQAEGVAIGELPISAPVLEIVQH